MHHDAERLATSAQWLANLRWVAVVGQLVTIGAVAGPLRVDVPVTPLLLMVAVTAGTNAAFWAAVRRGMAVGGLMPWLMLLDLLVLTGMLAVSGGTANPFSIFYFVNLALCGLLLRSRWAWPLAGVAVTAYGGLRCVSLPVAQLGGGELTPPNWRLLDAGGLVAFAACAGVIVWFATRVTAELARSESGRRRVEDLRARSEKLEALGTLAAGAAHELATPLSTIAVVAKELQREAARADAPPEVTADIELIRSEVDRCRAILDRMSMRSGEAPGEAPAATPVDQLIEEVLVDLPNRSRVATEFEYATAAARVVAPRTALSQALRALVQNGLDAVGDAGGDPAVRVVVGPALGGVEIAIHDAGAGMRPEVLERAGEPFFTTKAPGKGMGLGLFLARSIVDRLGGRLRLESKPGAGSTVRVTLPARIDAGSVGRPSTEPPPAAPDAPPAPTDNPNNPDDNGDGGERLSTASPALGETP